MPRLHLRWTLPAANFAIDAALWTLLAAHPQPTPHWQMPPEVTLIAAGTLPVGLFTRALLLESVHRWIWFHEGLVLLAWYGIGAWSGTGRTGAQRVCRIYLGLRLATMVSVLLPRAANFGALLLALMWFSAAVDLLRQGISHLWPRGARP